MEIVFFKKAKFFEYFFSSNEVFCKTDIFHMLKYSLTSMFNFIKFKKVKNLRKESIC